MSSLISGPVLRSSTTTTTSSPTSSQGATAPQPLVGSADGFAPQSLPGPSVQGQGAAVVDPASGLPTQVLRRGDHSPSVEQLQHALIKLHVMTSDQLATGPGWFGPRTQHAVETFQKAHHLPVTGVYDAHTRAAMSKALGHQPPAAPPKTRSKTPAPAAPSATRVPKGEAAQYQFFKRFVTAHGGRFLTGPNRMNIVGLRRDNRVGSGDGHYRDVAYVVYTDSKGKPHSKRFVYTTEPAANMRWDAGDANGDGSSDLGRIPNGFFTFGVSQRASGAPCLRPTSSFSPERDINHDGSFKEHYRSGNGDVFLFHRGGNYGTGSAGCQTFPPGEWDRFWGLVRHAHGNLGYTLTTTVPAGA